MAKFISTSTLAKQHSTEAKDLFSQFSKFGWIVSNGEKWELTEAGKKQGGVYKKLQKGGQYIAWPDDTPIVETNEPPQIISKDAKDASLSASSIGKHFDLSPIKTNFILSELGWIKKGNLKGWLVTKQGQQEGGFQAEDKVSGIPYVYWSKSILQSRSLIDSVNDVKGTGDTSRKDESIEKKEKGFREKFEAAHRATDGHFVRSKAEALIDNWLYMAGIVHAYERKLPIEEDFYSDFYIPSGKVYIEYWGYDNDAKYLKQKDKKKEIYQKYKFNLIELKDKDVQNLDDILPRLLLKYDVQAY